MAYNWTYKRIGDVCTVERGGSPRPIDTFITDSNDGINWIKIGDADDSMYITKTEQKIKPEGMKKSRFVEPGDFLLSNSMSFGRPYILKIDGCIHDGWLVLRDNNGAFDKRFLYFYLSSPTTYRRFKSMAVGGVVNNLNSEMVRKVEVPIPPMNEQIEIVNILEKAQAIISARKQQLTELDNLIKARFVEMFESHPRETVKAGSLFQEIRNGVSPSTSGIYTLKVLTLSSITQGAFDESAWKNGIFDKMPAADKRVSKTDFYICRGNGNKALVGTAAYSKHDCPDLVFPDTIIAARVDTSKVCLPYLFYAWKQPEVRMQIETGARTTNGTFKVNQKILSDIEIVIPPLDAQLQFAAIVDQIDKSKVVGLINGIMNGGVSSDSRPDGIETCPSEKCTK
jgi:type I restriction enzyme S subunit